MRTAPTSEQECERKIKLLKDFHRKERKGRKVGAGFKPAPVFFVFYAFYAVENFLRFTRSIRTPAP